MLNSLNLYQFFYETIFGKISISATDFEIVSLSFGLNKNDKCIFIETDLIRNAYLEICEYFDGKRKSFDVPLKIEGTEFQKKVWNCLISIPYGETRTYKEITEIVGYKKAYRAVGLANNRNPIGIFIPCHRIIGTNGNLIGYKYGLEIKEKLLNLEKRYS
jgi:methylated-DNA-[protein]-cysteine S-methyltransferase